VESVKAVIYTLCERSPCFRAVVLAGGLLLRENMLPAHTEEHFPVSNFYFTQLEEIMNTRNRTMIVLAVAGVAMAILAFTTTSAQAASITVVEHSFEGAKALGGWTGGGAAAGESTLQTPAPWTDLSGNSGTGWTTPAQYPGGLPDGDIYAWFNQVADTLGQTLAATLQADTTYTLTVATGWRADLPGLGFPIYPGYRIELCAGGTMLGFDADTTRGGTGTGPAVGTWKDVTATYTSPSSVTADALEIRLLAGNAVNGGTAIQTNYDNVRLDATPIPEPSTFALAALGLLGLLACGWRRRRWNPI